MSSQDPNKKRWVYKCLVQGDEDFVGLIAYSLYKKRKTELAEQHRAAKCDESVIKTKITEYHDMVVTGDAEISRFRGDAGRLLDDMLRKYAAPIKQEHEKLVASLSDQHKKDVEKARRQAVDDLAKTAKALKKESWSRDRVVAWILDGVQTTLAGILVTVFGFGLISFVASDDLKAAMVAKTVQVITGTSPVPQSQNQTP